MTSLTAPEIFAKLRGVFCLYKPRGDPVERVQASFSRLLVEDLNRKEQRPMRRLVIVEENNLGEVGVPVVTTVPDLADHPLVIGPRFVPEDISSLTPLNPLADESSGVQLFALGETAKEMLAALKPLVRVYHVTGRLGLATRDFLDTGRLVERASFRHVDERRLHRVVQAYQAGHRQQIFHRMGLDVQSQEAFEMAAQGLFRPKRGHEGLVAIGMELVKFSRPYFTLEVHLLNGDCEDLRTLVHRIGMELRTRAAAARIHRLRHGAAELEDALLATEVDCVGVLRNLETMETKLKTDLTDSVEIEEDVG